MGMREATAWLRPSPIRFSVTSEDSRVVDDALRIDAGDHVVTITSAGDTPLNCLRQGPAVVDAVDENGPQTYLAELKLAAMPRLSHHDFLVLVGVDRSGDALEAYSRVRSALSEEARRFWDARRAMIRGRLIRQGSMIQLFGLVRAVVHRLASAQLLYDLAHSRTPEQGEAFFREHVDTRLVRGIMRVLLSTPVFGAFYRHRMTTDAPTSRAYAMAMIRDLLRRVPVAGNPYVYPFVFGEYPPTGELPPYLDAAFYDQIADRVGRVRLRRASVMDHLRSLRDASVDAIELSNLIDWFDADAFDRLLREAARVARPGARLLAFSRSPMKPRPDLAIGLELDVDLSRALLEQDRTGYYRGLGVWRRS